MIHIKKCSVLVLLIFFILMKTSCDSHKISGIKIDEKIIGVKIYEHGGNFDQLFSQWHSLKINTVFVSASLDSNIEFRTLAKANSIKRFIILPVFYNPEELKKKPDLYAITNKDEKAIDEWVHFVCPTREEYRTQRIDYIKNIVAESQPDGISIDFIRYFAFWEKIYPERTLNSIPITCFCENCLKAFQQETGITIPEDLETTQKIADWILESYLEQWVEWRSEVISTMVCEIVSEAKKIKSDILVNLHAVPWRQDNFGGAIQIVTGQNYKKLAKYVDYLSPMCYHHMVKREPDWINSVVDDICTQTNCKIIPSIQVAKAYLEEELTTQAFREALYEALKEPSYGVVAWNWESLANDPEKMNVFEEIITEADLK